MEKTMADLTRSDIIRMVAANQRDFQNLDLSYLDMGGLQLANCNFSGAKLTRASFKGANLRHANLSDVDGWGADFSETDAEYAKFTGSYLPQSKFVGTKLFSASLNGVDLHEALVKPADKLLATWDRAWFPMRKSANVEVPNPPPMRPKHKYHRDRAPDINPPSEKATRRRPFASMTPGF